MGWYVKGSVRGFLAGEGGLWGAKSFLGFAAAGLFKISGGTFLRDFFLRFT